jgi:hypothetical protein
MEGARFSSEDTIVLGSGEDGKLDMARTAVARRMRLNELFEASTRRDIVAIFWLLKMCGGCWSQEGWG